MKMFDILVFLVLAIELDRSKLSHEKFDAIFHFDGETLDEWVKSKRIMKL